jgi:hypothetical protein
MHILHFAVADRFDIVTVSGGVSKEGGGRR